MLGDCLFFFQSRRRHTRYWRDWSSDVCSSDLAGLVSYNEKHNEANEEGNRDGTDDNRSWNCGVEGPTDDPEILALRRRQRSEERRVGKEWRSRWSPYH